MLKDITLGQYIAGNSPVHRADARLKLMLALLMIILLFMINTPMGYALFIGFTAASVLLSRIPLLYFIKGLKPMLFIIIFTVVLNLFLTPGDVVWSFKIFALNIKITSQGIEMSVMMFLRLTLLVTVTSLLTLTTSPMQLTDAIELLLKPLRVIKVPSHEIAMMMSIAIRFIPTFAEETDKIIKAQKARGADFESGNLVMRAKAMIPLLVPLFVSAFRRADELATAMDARCYNGGSSRTRMKQMKFEALDYKITAVFIVFTAGVLLIQYIL